MKPIRLFILLAFVCMQLQSFSQVEKYMAAFTYQICKATSFPTPSDDFVIAMVGDSEIAPFFEQMAKTKKIGTQSIKLTQWDESADNYHAVFITKDKTSQLSSIVSALDQKPVLIITESSGTIKKGANLSFKLVDNKIRYNLNKTDLSKRNISVQNTIERMALQVY